MMILQPTSRPSYVSHVMIMMVTPLFGIATTTVIFGRLRQTRKRMRTVMTSWRTILLVFAPNQNQNSSQK